MKPYISLMAIGSTILLVIHGIYAVISAEKFYTWSMYMYDFRYIALYYIGWILLLYGTYRYADENILTKKQ